MWIASRWVMSTRSCNSFARRSRSSAVLLKLSFGLLTTATRQHSKPVHLLRKGPSPATRHLSSHASNFVLGTSLQASVAQQNHGEASWIYLAVPCNRREARRNQQAALWNRSQEGGTQTVVRWTLSTFSALFLCAENRRLSGGRMRRTISIH